MSLSRSLLEQFVRRLLLQCRNVPLVDGVRVTRPLVEDGQVVGVLVERREHRADIAIDCSGSSTRSFDRLAEAGYPVPATSAIRHAPTNRTWVEQRRPGDVSDVNDVVVAPADRWRSGVMAPVENGRWMVTLRVHRGETPPIEDDQIDASTGSLPSSAIANVQRRSTQTCPRAPNQPDCRLRRVDAVKLQDCFDLLVGLSCRRADCESAARESNTVVRNIAGSRHRRHSRPVGPTLISQADSDRSDCSTGRVIRKPRSRPRRTRSRHMSSRRGR